MPVSSFRDHIRMLRDSGYHAILPDQLVDCFLNRRPLPGKPVLITFDDGTESQFRVAAPILDMAGFKAIFFIMTVALDKPRYMTRQMVRDLVTRGHLIGCHTWDHHSVINYTDADWTLQVQRPVAELEKITGSPIRYFAYPFGAWNHQAIPHLKGNGITAAFQLWGMKSPDQPLYSIRRILVDGGWSAARLSQEIRNRY